MVCTMINGSLDRFNENKNKETELHGVYLPEKGKFYKLAFEEELYD